MVVKNFFKCLLSVLAFALFAVSCDDEEESVSETLPSPDPIGSYAFDGTEYDIVYGGYFEDEVGYYFLFSPQPQENRQTVFMLGLVKQYVGRDNDVTTLYTGDYLFMYEDSDYYYPPDYKLQSGVIRVSVFGDGGFEVHLNVRLPDGKPFSADFNGQLELVDSSEFGADS